MFLYGRQRHHIHIFCLPRPRDSSVVPTVVLLILRLPTCAFKLINPTRFSG